MEVVIHVNFQRGQLWFHSIGLNDSNDEKTPGSSQRFEGLSRNVFVIVFKKAFSGQ